MAITTRATKGSELTWDELDANFRDLDVRTAYGWKDLTTSISSAGVPLLNAPTAAAFGPSGLREEFRFSLNDYVFCQSFHVGHDIKPGGKAYVHVHWTTGGTQTNPVRWELQISRALRASGNFGSPISLFVQEPAHGTAWRHMVTEVGDADALTLEQPDELILVTLRRVTNGGVNNTDPVFALAVDFHYEADRDTTPLRAAPFYTT